MKRERGTPSSYYFLEDFQKKWKWILIGKNLVSECLQAPRVREPPANKQTEDRARRGSPGAGGGGGGRASPGPRRASPRPRPARDHPPRASRLPAGTAAGRAATPRQPGPQCTLAPSTMPRPPPSPSDCEIGWGETQHFYFSKQLKKRVCSPPPPPPDVLVHSSRPRGGHHVLSLPPPKVWPLAPASRARPGQVGSELGGVGGGVVGRVVCTNVCWGVLDPVLRAPRP